MLVESTLRYARAEPTGASEPRAREAALRARLGIPTGAARVLVLTESSHWDPNWLLTSEEYFALRVRGTLDRALAELARDPRRVYSVECLFFLAMYWERCPERRGAVRALLDAGRLRLAGCGMSTPDTLIPSGEAVVRDYLAGQEWLRRRGLRAEPSVAYFPDSFGHSPELPAVLAALGIDKAVLTRVDGMYFPGTDLRARGDHPRPGTTAHTLLRAEQTLDFVWRAADGSEVLCHVNAFTYSQGDLLAHAGVTRWMGAPLAVARRSPAHVARRVAGYVRDLGPLARTPYMLCPIGFDFVDPIVGLGDLLAEHNRSAYPATGVYVVNAGLDDYLDLVGCHRRALPTLALDPNPYWMGFLASRGEIKRRCRRAVDGMLTLEARSTLAPDAAAGRAQPLEQLWERVAVTNHHDFVTGTSPDRVAHGEQRRWLETIEAQVEAELARADAAAPATSTRAEAPARYPWWSLAGGELRVRTEAYTVVLDALRGGAITSWCAPSGEPLVRAPSNDLVLHRDSGGLWRMGHELVGGAFEPIWRASEHPARIEAREHGGNLEVVVTQACESRPLLRRLWFREGDPAVRMRIEGSIGRRRTLVCQFATAARSRTARMDVAGGVAERAARKLYDPTFWHCTSWARLVGSRGTPGFGVVLGGPASLSFREDGEASWPALRNATQERSFGVVPLLGFPASGTEDGPGALDYAVLLTGAGARPASDGAMARLALTALPAASVGDVAPLRVVPEAERSPDSEIVLAACKWASRGPGLIARLGAYGPLPARVTLRHARTPIARAFVCDARERDRHELPVDGGAARVVVDRSITTVRVILAP